MKKQYFIDGNNLICKIPELWELQKKDGQASRERLARLIDNYFFSTSHEPVIFYDGFKNDPIPTSKTRIVYCEKRTADEDIKTSIMNSKNPKHITVISSDHSVMQFSAKSSCSVVKSEDFARRMTKKHDNDSEQKRIKSISNDEIKKMFGV